MAPRGDERAPAPPAAPVRGQVRWLHLGIGVALLLLVLAAAAAARQAGEGHRAATPEAIAGAARSAGNVEAAGGTGARPELIFIWQPG